MKKIIYTFLACLAFYSLDAQSTAEEVYAIVQNKCASCHSGASPAAGLDFDVSNTDLHNLLIMGDVSNAAAAAKGDKLIYPGRTDKSYLFRKVNLGLEESAPLDLATEGTSMPPYGSTQLTIEEKEVFRQWILYGAPDASEGYVIDHSLINDYYNNNGVASFPSGAPAAPDASEGFQVKMGPFLLAPGDEIEYFQKYELDLPSNVEITRVETIISNYSHHCILYAFDDNTVADGLKHGFREEPYHDEIRLVTVAQESVDIQLPGGTAFFWKQNEILDLNTHYINYNATQTYLAEAYINVYTQPTGTAIQEMRTQLIPNTNFYVPNDGNEYTFQDVFSYPLNFDIYVWNLGGHTHKYGTDFDVYRQNIDGSQGEKIYDASCPEGIPGCAAPFFDYQHIPFRTWDEFTPINLQTGVLMEASYVNDGPVPVGWGATSDDEMMLIAIMYVYSLIGVDVGVQEATLVDLEELMIRPNPFNDLAVVELPADYGATQATVFDMLGKSVQHYDALGGENLEIRRNGLAPGVYILQLQTESGALKTTKLMISK